MAILKNLTINDTGFLQIPSGTIAQRPTSPSQGMIRYNTDFKENEYYNGTDWITGTGENSIVTDGLVLWLDAAEPSSYPGSGTTWTDLSGNGNTGTLVNGVGYNSGNGGSLVFDGVNDFITLATPTNFSGDFSYCAWVYRSVVSPNGYTNVFTSTLQNEQYQLDLTGYQGGFGMYAAGAYNATQSNLISLNTWVNLVWIRKDTGLYGYLNGAEQFNPSNGFNAGLSTVSTAVSKVNKIGAYSTGTSYNLNGNIAQVSIYNRALTAAEVSQNFNATRSRFSI